MTRTPACQSAPAGTWRTGGGPPVPVPEPVLAADTRFAGEDRTGKVNEYEHEYEYEYENEYVHAHAHAHAHEDANDAGRFRPGT